MFDMADYGREVSVSSFLIFGLKVIPVGDACWSRTKAADDVFEILSRAAADSDVEVYRVEYTDEVYDEVYAGVSWDEIGDDETGAQFKSRAVDAVNRIVLPMNGALAASGFATYQAAWKSDSQCS